MIYEIEMLLEMQYAHTTKALREAIKKTICESEEFLLKKAKRKMIVSKVRNTFQYYLVEEGNKRKYLRKSSDKKYIEELAYIKYHQDRLHTLRKCYSAICEFEKNFNFDIGSEICRLTDNGLLPYVADAHVDRRQYAENWLRQINRKKQQGFRTEELKHPTSFGLSVRSKSEVMIAEALHRHGIPFKYEDSVRLKDYGTAYPDFTCLNRRTCRTIIWEHLGMLDDTEYVEKALLKIQSYGKNEYSLRKNLIITAENKRLPLTVWKIEEKIKEYLL